MSCEYCHIGHYELSFSPYVHWYHGKIMVIPNAPAYSCDICGHMEYDENFLQKLNHLLNRFAEVERNTSATYRRPAVFEPALMPATRRGQ
jgi:YgiT-type zinc finger domain-containing protein